MKKLINIALIFWGINLGAFADDVALQDVINAGLPVLYVETDDNEEPTYTPVTHPEGQFGYGITNATKVPGRVWIELGGGILYDSGDYVDKTSGMTIKVRGNTSAYASKKPYKIKLQKKADLLNRGDDSKYADKNWILINDDALKFKIGFKVNEIVGLQWTPQYMYVNMVFNGVYRGLYMLLESVERNTECRLNVKKTGYIFELDAYWWNEDKYFESTLSSQMNYTYKYPDSDDVTDEQNEYIQNVIATVEASLDDGTYPNYIDVSSFAAWMLGHDLLGNIDGAGSNMYFTKYDNTDDTKILMGNLWDFDNIMRSSSWDAVHNAYYFIKLFKNANKSFVRAYKEKWETLSSTFSTIMAEYLDSYASSDEAAAFDASILLDNQRYSQSNTSVSTRVEAAKEYFANRDTWLETKIADINDQEAVYSNTLSVHNSGTVTIAGNSLSNGDNFNTTACTDVLMTFVPGTNMSLTSLKIDDVDVTADVLNNEYTISNVLGSHAIEVRYDRNLIAMTDAYATYCSTADLDFSDQNDLSAYVVSSYDEDESTILLQKVTQVPAGTGLILVGTPGESYKITLTEDAPTIDDNLLIGLNASKTVNPIDGDNRNYILARTAKSGIGFYKLTGSGTMSEGKSYLQLPVSLKAATKAFIFIDDMLSGTETTTIKKVKIMEDDSAYYSLTGQKVSNSQHKGIYVSNGKKINKK